MAICDYCGEEIEFRYIDGRIVPIHPDGGWHCDGWPAELRSRQYWTLSAGTGGEHWEEFYSKGIAAIG